jgi:hypothetical protein
VVEAREPRLSDRWLREARLLFLGASLSFAGRPCGLRQSGATLTESGSLIFDNSVVADGIFIEA